MGRVAKRGMTVAPMGRREGVSLCSGFAAGASWPAASQSDVRARQSGVELLQGWINGQPPGVDADSPQPSAGRWLVGQLEAEASRARDVGGPPHAFPAVACATWPANRPMEAGGPRARTSTPSSPTGSVAGAKATCPMYAVLRNVDVHVLRMGGMYLLTCLHWRAGASAWRQIGRTR